MNVKKIIIAGLSLLWVLFFLVDFLTRLISGVNIFRKWKPFVFAAKGIQRIKNYSVFALIIMNILLVLKFLDTKRLRSKA